ncbi:hypothetical protein JTB14_019761 [Gonioctena quinquepunctata]|nr:hypothetical protein JTB14_019761 [Gonioctena quinquepunctata]
MTYEEGQRRLQQIWDEIRLEEEVGGVSSVHSSDDEDCIQDSDHFSDTEQSDVSDNDSDVSVGESEVPLAHRLQFYQGRSGKTWLKIPYTISVKRKPCDVIRIGENEHWRSESTDSNILFMCIHHPDESKKYSDVTNEEVEEFPPFLPRDTSTPNLDRTFDMDVDMRQERRTNGEEPGIIHVSKDVSDDVPTSVPDFVRDPPILPRVEGEENWDADNFITYVPNLDRDIVRGPLIGKSKKEKRKFRQSERLRHYRLEEQKNLKI